MDKQLNNDEIQKINLLNKDERYILYILKLLKLNYNKIYVDLLSLLTQDDIVYIEELINKREGNNIEVEIKSIDDLDNIAIKYDSSHLINKIELFIKSQNKELLRKLKIITFQFNKGQKNE
jgi:hypothetical protein